MMSWAMGDKLPLRATGTGGRQARVEKMYGNIYDHFAIEFEYENNVQGFSFSRQMQNCSGRNSFEIAGTLGNAVVKSSGELQITGKNNWTYQCEKNDPYQTQHDELFASIRNNKPMNDGIRMANSTMLARLGRLVAYSGQTLSWDEAINSNHVLGPVHSQMNWNNPDAVMEDPLFKIEMLRTGDQISSAMDKRVRESCNVSAFTMRFDLDGWTPAARDAVKTKALGTLASAIDSVCRDQTQKEEIMNSLYAITFRNTLGSGTPQIIYEEGNFVLTGDFSQISDEFTVRALRNQLISAAQKDASEMEKMKPQIDEMCKNYPDSLKDETSKP